MDFVPRVLKKAPPADFVLQRLEKRHCQPGKKIPFERVYWRPPLQPRAAYDLECRQIRELLGLDPLVSITDHDDISACAELQTLGAPVPYSTEWSVPYHETIFHLGVHNLPAEMAADLEKEMARYTAAPSPQLLTEILATLDGIESVLTVLNHPLSCEARLERAEHVRLLNEFLRLHGARLHALELNGLQPAADNREVVRIAAAAAIPVISGGDRHCLEPNANVNLTNAATFEEFVSEVRRDCRSQVLFLPQYRESIVSRYIQFIWHAVKDYPDATGRERWSDRVFFTDLQGNLSTVSALWPSGGPKLIGWFISTVGLMAAPPVRAALHLALGEQGEMGA